MIACNNRLQCYIIFVLVAFNCAAVKSCWFIKCHRNIWKFNGKSRKINAMHKQHNRTTIKQLKNGIGDANDVWKIMIVGGGENETVLTVTSKLLIVHYIQNCALTTSGKQLPKWGYEQQEVSCNPNVRDPSAYWNVEDNVFDKCKYLNVCVYIWC